MSGILRSERARHARRADRGFTLVEMVITISVMGLIGTVVAAVITTTFRNNPMNELRTDVAHTLKGVVTWLPQDVDSTPPTGFDTNPATASGCTQNPGKNLLRMEWSEAVGGVTTRYVANYRWVTSGANEIIQRVTCFGSGANPLGNSHIINASGPLMKMTGAWVPGNLPARVLITYDATGDVSLVSFDVQTEQGDILHVDSAPKNPGNTLPPTTADAGVGAVTTVLATTTTAAPATTSATTTTVLGATTTTAAATTTTTTIPPTTTTVPCLVTGLSMSATTLKNTDPNGKGNAAVNVGVLATELTVTATVSGQCSGLSARASTGAPNGELFRNFSSVTATSFQVVFPGFPQGSSELWMDGNRVISVYSPTGAVLGSVTLAVK